MKNKNSIKSLLFVITFVFALALISAVPTLVTPADNSVISGATASINVTNGTLIDILNCTIYASSSLTANISASSLGTLTNESTSALYINGTIDTTILEDANNYQIYASCWNNTEQQNTTASTITIDNTVPQTPSSLSPVNNFRDEDGTITFSGTVTGANTTSCTLQFSGILPTGGNAQAMTHTGNSCSLTLTAVSDQTYNWFIRASDGTNTTDSNTLSVLADVTTSAGKAAKLIEQRGVTSKGGALLSVAGENGQGEGIGTGAIVIILLVIGLVLFFLLKRK